MRALVPLLAIPFLLACGQRVPHCSDPGYISSGRASSGDSDGSGTGNSSMASGSEDPEELLPSLPVDGTYGGYELPAPSDPTDAGAPRINGPDGS